MKKNKKINSIIGLAAKIIILTFAGLVFNTGIYACICGYTQVNEAYKEADTIIVGKVVKIENPELTADGFYKGNQKVQIKIIKSYKGYKNEILTLSQENSTCDWWFDDEKNLNKDYLFYLFKHKNKKFFSVIPCGRSKSINDASDDISWLFDLPKSLKRTRISGVVRINDDASTFPPLANVKIKIIGERNFDLTTDKNGFYEVWDVPIGKYKVTAEIPEKYILVWTSNVSENWIYFWRRDKDEKSLEITLKSNDSGGIDFMLEGKKDEK